VGMDVEGSWIRPAVVGNPEDEGSRGPTQTLPPTSTQTATPTDTVPPTETATATETELPPTSAPSLPPTVGPTGNPKDYFRLGLVFVLIALAAFSLYFSGVLITKRDPE